MAYTTIDRHPVRETNAARTLLVLTAGVLFGLMIAQLGADGQLEEALTTPPIAGEDWHGNVKRSTP